MPGQGLKNPFMIPAVLVKDEPRFAYRAFMLDAGRNFIPKKEVLRLLDVMALYKLNCFSFSFNRR